MISLYSIPKIIAIFAGIYAILISVCFSIWHVEISGVNIFRYVALFELLIYIIFFFVWEYIWYCVPIFNKWFFPNLNGKWDVEINWTWDKEGGVITKGIKRGELYIKQNFIQLSMELLTDESESETLVVQPKKHVESGRLQLYYIYRNTSKNCKNKLVSSHIGTAILKSSHENYLILEGNYFTDRNTKGSFKFTKQDN